MCRYFEQTGIDFLLSPYTIIENYLIDNAKRNSFTLLIYNNIIYAIIYNNKKQLSYNKINVLTPFELTQDMPFLEDDILSHKLYEEVIFLEIQQFLTETIKDYYTKAHNIDFLEHIEILYTLKSLSNKQVTSLEKIIMIPIEYNEISLNEYMDDIAQAKNANFQNFIAPRVRKNTKNIYVGIILILLIFIVGISIFNFGLDTHKDTNNLVTKAKINQNIESLEATMISLPHHSEKNKIIVHYINMLFDVVPYDSVLKEIEINEDNSTFVTNFIATSMSISDMQTKLRNIYSNSKILLESKNDFTINTIIQNNELISKFHITKKTKSVKHDFLSTAEASIYLKKIILQNSEIIYDSTNQDTYLTYNFSINSKIKSPKDFFEFVSKINTQPLSIELSYPITFSKINNFIEVNYKLKLNQLNNKQIQLRK